MTLLIADLVALAAGAAIARIAGPGPERAGVVWGFAQPAVSTNEADRLRKYLARFGLDWAQISAMGRLS